MLVLGGDVGLVSLMCVLVQGKDALLSVVWYLLQL